MKEAAQKIERRSCLRINECRKDSLCTRGGGCVPESVVGELISAGGGPHCHYEDRAPSAVAPSSGAFCVKVRRSLSAETWIGSPSWNEPLRISSANGSSSERSTERRIGRAPYCGS